MPSRPSHSLLASQPALLGLLALLGSSGCEDSVVPLVDGGVGRRLEIMDPPGAQIGLRFSRSLELAVRYVTDDERARPIRDEPVRFAIFDDPVGSTLSRDKVSTDDDGLARVTLNGGTQEGAFRVRASAASAADAEFAISISELEFVDLDAVITDPLPNSGGRTLIAALFTDRSCADLPPTPKMLGAARTLGKTAAKSTTLSFVNLLSRTYAVAGRIEDAGELVAYGCLDIDRALAPPGAHLSLPLPMTAVAPSIVGAFDLVTQLGSTRSHRADSLLADYDVVDRCETHLGQLVLDEIVLRLSAPRAAAAATHRGATTPSTVDLSTVACRPSKLAAADTLDAELGALLAAGTSGAARGPLWGDLDAVMASASMTSTLGLSATAPFVDDGSSAPQRLLADHVVHTITLSLSGTTRVYDLAALGRPIYAAMGVGADRSGTKLEVAKHAIPLALPELWGTTWNELAIAARLPSLSDTTVSGWVHACAAEAQRNAKFGCAAIEDLVCERTGGPAGCTGTLLTPCAQAVSAVADRMTNAWASAPSLSLMGTARIVDDDADLIGNRLQDGVWTATGTIAQALTFSGQRSQP